jgi:hypothetical protein
MGNITALTKKLGFSADPAMRYLLPAGIGAAGGALLGGENNRFGGALGGAALGAGAGHLMGPGVAAAAAQPKRVSRSVARNMEKSLRIGQQAVPSAPESSVAANMQNSMRIGQRAVPSAPESSVVANMQNSMRSGQGVVPAGLQDTTALGKLKRALRINARDVPVPPQLKPTMVPPSM